MACLFLSVVLGKAKSTCFPLWTTVAPASFTQLLGELLALFHSLLLSWELVHRDWAGKANKRQPRRSTWTELGLWSTAVLALHCVV